jgi:hypothetical protein
MQCSPFINLNINFNLQAPWKGGKQPGDGNKDKVSNAAWEDPWSNAA